MILVTGGTGLVGRYLVKALTSQGLPVRCLLRSEKSTEYFLNVAESVRGDVTMPSTLGPACAGVDSVIHLVAVIRESGSATFERINVQGTQNMVAAAENAGVSRFIYMSALGAANNPAYRYTHSKWLAEEIVRQSMLNYTIFRPSLLYGEGFNFFNRLRQSLKMCPPPFVPVPGGGHTRFQPMAVEDLVRCVLLALEDPAFNGKICEVGGPEHLSYSQMLDTLLEVTGQTRIKLPVPLPLMRLVVPAMGLLLKDPPVTLVELKQLEHDNITDLTAVQNSFGFKPRPLRDGLSCLAG